MTVFLPARKLLENMRAFGRAQVQAQNSKLDAGLAYATERRWLVFPAPVGKKRSHKSKKRSGTNWGATRDPDQIRKDWKRWPNANIGIPTGVENGIFVVDIDTLVGHGVDGIASLKELEATHGKLPDTLMAMSPSGSIHYYFKHPGSGTTIKKSTSEIAPGIDIVGDNGMVIAPPSTRTDGVYRWLNDLPIGDAPAWLLELIIERPRQQQARLPSNLPPPDIEELREALRIIPNPDLGWKAWNRVAMAIYAATDGGDDGFELFCEWSRKSSKHTDEGAHRKWYHELESTPPEEIGVGTLFWLASEADPNWREAAAWRKFCGRAS
jgi:hypothetical protein